MLTKLAIMEQKEIESLLYRLFISRPKDFFAGVEGLRTGMGGVLWYIDAVGGSAFPADIAKTLGISTARVATILNKIETGNYVSRSDSTEDARKTVVSILPAGKEYLDCLRNRVLGVANGVIEEIGRDDIEKYVSLSEKIKSVSEKHVKGAEQ